MNIPQLINPKGRGASIRELPTATKVGALLIGFIVIAAVVLILRIGGTVSTSLTDGELSKAKPASSVEAMRFAMALSDEISELETFGASSPLQNALTAGSEDDPAAQTALD